MPEATESPRTVDDQVSDLAGGMILLGDACVWNL